MKTASKLQVEFTKDHRLYMARSEACPEVAVCMYFCALGPIHLIRPPSKTTFKTPFKAPFSV